MRIVIVSVCVGAAWLICPPEAAWAQPSPRAAAPVGDDAARSSARPLASEGAALFDAGRYADAIDRFMKADKLYPTPHYRVYVARAHANLGKLTLAMGAYERAIALAVPASAPPSFRDIQAIAAAELLEIRRRVATVQIVVAGPSAGEARVTIDGEEVRAAELAKKVLDPGPHTVGAAAPGFRAATQTIDAKEGGVQQVSLTLERAARSGPLDGSSALAAQGSPEASRQGDAAPLAHQDHPPLSHRGQIGALARADIDPVHGGAVLAAGASYGIIDHFEIVAAALVGRDKGVEPGLTFFMLTGAWKPFVNAGAPIFFMDGAHVGVRGAAGLQWDPVRHFGAFVQVGGAYFGSAPDDYDNGLFLPSAGVQGRL
jgi:PEGA domain